MMNWGFFFVFTIYFIIVIIVYISACSSAYLHLIDIFLSRALLSIIIKNGHSLYFSIEKEWLRWYIGAKILALVVIYFVALISFAKPVVLDPNDFEIVQNETSIIDHHQNHEENIVWDFLWWFYE